MSTIFDTCLLGFFGNAIPASWILNIVRVYLTFVAEKIIIKINTRTFQPGGFRQLFWRDRKHNSIVFILIITFSATKVE